MQFPIVALIAHRLEDFISDLKEISPQHAKDVEVYVDVLRSLFSRGITGLTPGEDERNTILRSLPTKWNPDAAGVIRHDVEFLLATPSRVAARLVERELQACGYRVVSAASAFEAFEIGIRTRPDMIITSAVMDELSGLDLARAFASMQVTRTIPFAILTSFTKDHEALRGLPDSVSIVRIGASFSDDLAKAITSAGTF